LSISCDWPQAIIGVLLSQNVDLVAHVPDAGHAALIRLAEGHDQIDVVTLTSEEEGVGLLCGAWAGGRNGVLLMQSSGVGNCINALALPEICRIPFLTIVSMRGEWEEFVPWQIPMGLATPKVFEAMHVEVFRATEEQHVAETVDAAGDFAFTTRRSAAVLLSQQMLGAKQFKEG
jgi:sulfopyruvate decarboxylase alpha subunit|tara:strand:- start:184 stop:708 length:525 start_codon:yes stop_codon:yes gene_type:complete